MTLMPIDRRAMLGLTGLLLASQAGRLGATADARERTDAHTLLFDTPATDWIDSLPIGNGRLGAIMRGGVAREILSLNEDTLWSGQPLPPPDTRGAALLGEMRDLVFAGDYQAADRLSHDMQGPYSQAYEPLADLTLDIAHAAAPTGYHRMLDLDAAIAPFPIRSMAFASRARCSLRIPIRSSCCG